MKSESGFSFAIASQPFCVLCTKKYASLKKGMLPPPLVVVVTNISYGDGSHILVHIETEIDHLT